jgi:hypothetical protein
MMYQMASKSQNNPVYSLVLVCVAVACQATLTSAAFATTDTEETYIDSVYSWGIWELGLEPVNGPQVSTNIAMNDRSRQLLFRPNDNAAYIPRSIPVPAAQPPALLPTPSVGVSGSGPILPGMVPNPPNLR